LALPFNLVYTAGSKFTTVVNLDPAEVISNLLVGKPPSLIELHKFGGDQFVADFVALILLLPVEEVDSWFRGRLAELAAELNRHVLIIVFIYMS